MSSFLAVVWDISPTIFPEDLGFISEIRYYGLAWSVAFGIAMLLITNFMKREGYSEKMFDSFFWYATISTIIGARLGHCLFYDTDYYLMNPIEILNLRQGGLASHGAALGILIGLCLFSKKNKMPYLWSLDRIMLPVAIGGAFVRFGNLMNSEIYGVETDAPWGFVFVVAGETVPKHPTQIYEALCYLLIFVVALWMYYKKDLARKMPGLIFGFTLTGIFVSRFFIEYIKNPQASFEVNMSLFMGQWLSIPFVILGVSMMVIAIKKRCQDGCNR